MVVCNTSLDSSYHSCLGGRFSSHDIELGYVFRQAFSFQGWNGRDPKNLTCSWESCTKHRIFCSKLCALTLCSISAWQCHYDWRGIWLARLCTGEADKKLRFEPRTHLLGAIWGYWHLPICLMGWNFPNMPVLGALILTPISTIFMGIYLAWLYLRSRSIWMPTLAHAAMNLTGVLLLNEFIMQRDEPFLQLMFIAAWGIVAAFCLISLNRQKPMLWQATNVEANKIQHEKL